MSDNYINIIPQNSSFIPDLVEQEHIRDVLHKICPKSEMIEIEINEGVQFRDCGSNFERVICPNCHTEINIDSWQSLMDKDYDSEMNGFLLNKYSVPCCEKLYNLSDLKYEFEQGFSRFLVGCMNPNRLKLSPDEIAQVEEVAKFSIKVIYQHL